MAYVMGMEFEWGEAKNSACFERRDFDFAYAVWAFRNPYRIVARDRRREWRGPLPAARQDRRAPVCRRLRCAGFGRSHHFGPQGQWQGGRGL